MTKEIVWIRPECETVINSWFVDYLIKYRQIIEKKYPRIHKEINDIVLQEQKR